MEHVEGVRIDDYCEERNLSTGGRLRLFLEVCRGVSYAHQHLVVHRDIKPSNILVSAEGVPKLLDFGIAKLLDPEQASDEQTRTELRAFTPDYASPEQAAGGQITTASDVYSLGVLLRDLLHGASQASEARKSPGGWRSETPGQKMAAAKLPTDKESEGGKTHTWTRRFVGSEVENIVAMARREDPARRYATAAELAEDVQRYLDRRPVRARKDSFTYRAIKFIRRNKVGVAAAALVLLSLVGGIVATVWQARRATAERDRARIEAAKAARINEFLQNVLGFSQVNWLSPNPQKKSVSTIAEALDEASRRAEQELGDQPEILASVQFSLGPSYAGQGKENVAEQLLRASLENRRRVLGTEHPDTAQSMAALANHLVYQGKFAEAESLSREAVTVYRQVRERGDADPRWFFVALNGLGISLISKGEAPAGEAALLEAVEAGANFTGEERGGIAAIYSNLGISRGNQGDVEGAVDYLQKSVGEMRRLPGEPGIALAQVIGNLGSFMTIKGEYAGAELLLSESLEEHLRRALALRVKSLKPGHWRLAETQGALGGNLTAQRRYAEAEPLLTDSHNALEASLSGRDPRTRQARRRLITLYESWHKPEEAPRSAQP